jgi:hypothetical protein
VRLFAPSSSAQRADRIASSRQQLPRSSRSSIRRLAI